MSGTRSRKRTPIDTLCIINDMLTLGTSRLLDVPREKAEMLSWPDGVQDGARETHRFPISGTAEDEKAQAHTVVPTAGPEIPSPPTLHDRCEILLDDQLLSLDLPCSPISASLQDNSEPVANDHPEQNCSNASERAQFGRVQELEPDTGLSSHELPSLLNETDPLDPDAVNTLFNSLAWLNGPLATDQPQGAYVPNSAGTPASLTDPSANTHHDANIGDNSDPETDGEIPVGGDRDGGSDWQGLIELEWDRSLSMSRPSEPDAFENSLFRHSLHPLHADRNPYTSVYAELAIESRSLRNVVLFAAANHLVIGSGMSTWSVKLSGVCNLLVGVSSNPRKSNLDPKTRFLWLQYTWMVLIGRTLWISGCSSMPLSSLQLPEQCPEMDTQLSKDQEEWYGNLPDYSVVIFLRTATRYSQQMSEAIEQVGSGHRIQQIIPDISDLIACIRSWQPKSSSAMEPYARSARDVAELWRQGLLCYIYTDLCALSTTHARIQQCVTNAMPAIHRPNWLQCTLWPVFMVALHITDPGDQEVVERSLRQMGSLHHFKTPLSLIEILREVWSSPALSKNWKHIVAESGMELNILL
ncbi:hypothetical protein FE257_010444 [Aspergillus nanangensis]|uniref:Transcription factor domain-containing protein n=1 Tax=Aspergillus nanangensis TaxID=2582783 RepID=A0AAD4CIM8_ASPNN|nr:hypothetical protein FE257_010444 [Aspergillus nanangensis]